MPLPVPADNEMLAIHTDSYGPPREVLHLKTLPRPILRSQTVLIRILSASTHAGDWHLIRGTPFFIRLLFGTARKPTIHIPGSDMCGLIEAVSPDVTALAVGDVVFADLSDSGFGAFAQYVVAPANVLVKKPENVSPRHAAASCTSAVAALQTVRDIANVQPGHAVLVNGASGGVGSFAVQIAKAFGATVTAVCRKEKAGAMTTIGADKVVVYETTDVSKAEERYDVVVDTACFRSPFEYLPIVKKGGTYAMVGGATSRFLQMMVVGSWISMTRGVTAKFVETKPNVEDLNTIRDMLQSGKICPLIDRSFSLEQVADAISYVEDRKVTGKVTIDM